MLRVDVSRALSLPAVQLVVAPGRTCRSGLALAIGPRYSGLEHDPDHRLRMPGRVVCVGV